MLYSSHKLVWLREYPINKLDNYWLEYHKNLNNWTVCYEVQNSLLWKGGKKHGKNTAPSPPPRPKKKQKFLDLTRRGKSNDIAHRPIIQVSTGILT